MSNLSDRFTQYGLDLASSGTEYLSWDETAGATSYSPAGQSLPTAAANRDLVAGSDIQSADLAVLEIRPSSASPEWVPASEIFPYHEIGASAYGMRVVSGTAADDGILRVEFATDGAESGKTWSTASGEGWQWRLRRITQSNVSNPVLASSSSPGLLSVYDEGTFTMSEASKSNLTGTGSFPIGKYIRIGNMVHCYVGDISGYSVTSASSVRTFVEVNLSGLPGTDADRAGSLSGSGYAASSVNDLGTALRIGDGGGGSRFILEFTSQHANGAHNFLEIGFTYMIGQ